MRLASLAPLLLALFAAPALAAPDDDAGIKPTGRGGETTDQGERRWARDLGDALVARQRPDGSFVNQADGRHREQDPVLCTAYALDALSDARPFLAAPLGPY